MEWKLSSVCQALSRYSQYPESLSTRLPAPCFAGGWRDRAVLFKFFRETCEKSTLQFPLKLSDTATWKYSIQRNGVSESAGEKARMCSSIFSLQTSSEVGGQLVAVSQEFV